MQPGSGQCALGKGLPGPIDADIQRCTRDVFDRFDEGEQEFTVRLSLAGRREPDATAASMAGGGAERRFLAKQTRWWGTVTHLPIIAVVTPAFELGDR
eukprot:COSAG03_NODE_1872_length_3401_cov_1.450636_3_plen_98_part_00